MNAPCRATAPHTRLLLQPLGLVAQPSPANDPLDKERDRLVPPTETFRRVSVSNRVGEDWPSCGGAGRKILRSCVHRFLGPSVCFPLGKTPHRSFLRPLRGACFSPPFRSALSLPNDCRGSNQEPRVKKVQARISTCPVVHQCEFYAVACYVGAAPDACPLRDNDLST